MDNQTYLNQIAVKQTTSRGIGNFFTPTMIKIIIGAVIALIFVIILGSILNSANQKTIDLYTAFHLRLQNLTAGNGPLSTYTKNLKSSDLRSPDLRSLAGNLQTYLTSTSLEMSSLLSTLKVDTSNPSEQATADSNISSYTSELADAKLNGVLDRTFASSTALQISILLSMESEIRAKTDNSSLANLMDRSSADLNKLLAQFTNYSNSH